MPHVIVILNEAGEPIGEYYPPHDPDTGGKAAPPSVTFNLEAAADSIHAAIGENKEPTSIEVSFKGKR